MQFTFLNAYTATLAQVLSSNEGSTTLVLAGSTSRLAAVVGDGVVCAITLFNDTHNEIVYATEVDGQTVTVLRAREGTTRREWLEGTNIEARVTEEGIKWLKTRLDAEPGQLLLAAGEGHAEGIQLLSTLSAGYSVSPVDAAIYAPTVGETEYSPRRWFFSESGRYALLTVNRASSDAQAILYDMQENTKTALAWSHNTNMHGAAFSPDDSHIAVTFPDLSELLVYEVSGLSDLDNPLYKIDNSHPLISDSWDGYVEARGVTFAENGARVVAALTGGNRDSDPAQYRLPFALVLDMATGDIAVPEVANFDHYGIGWLTPREIRVVESESLIVLTTQRADTMQSSMVLSYDTLDGTWTLREDATPEQMDFEDFQGTSTIEWLTDDLLIIFSLDRVYSGDALYRLYNVRSKVWVYPESAIHPAGERYAELYDAGAAIKGVAAVLGMGDGTMRVIGLDGEVVLTLTKVDLGIPDSVTQTRYGSASMRPGTHEIVTHIHQQPASVVSFSIAEGLGVSAEVQTAIRDAQTAITSLEQRVSDAEDEIESLKVQDAIREVEKYVHNLGRLTLAAPSAEFLPASGYDIAVDYVDTVSDFSVNPSLMWQGMGIADNYNSFIAYVAGIRDKVFLCSCSSAVSGRPTHFTYDVATGRYAEVAALAAVPRITRGAISSDRGRVAFAHNTGSSRLTVYSVAEEALIPSPFIGTTVASCAFDTSNPSLVYITTLATNRPLQVVDLDAGSVTTLTTLGGTGSVEGLAEASGVVYAGYSVAPRLRAFDATTGAAVSGLPEPSANPTDVSISPDGLRLAFVSSSQLTVYLIADWSVERAFSGSSMSRATWSPDGQLLAIGRTSGGTAYVFDATDWAADPVLISEGNGRGYVGFSADGEHALTGITGSLYRPVLLLNTENWRVQSWRPSGTTTTYYQLHVDETGEYVVAARDNFVTVSKIQYLELVRDFHVNLSTNRAAILIGARYLMVCVSIGAAVRLYDMQNDFAAVTLNFTVSNTFGLLHVPGQQQVYVTTGLTSPGLAVVDISDPDPANWATVSSPPTIDGYNADGMLSPDGTMVAMAGNLGLRVIDTDTLTLVSEASMSGSWRRPIWSDDGSKLLLTPTPIASSGASASLRVINVADWSVEDIPLAFAGTSFRASSGAVFAGESTDTVFLHVSAPNDGVNTKTGTYTLHLPTMTTLGPGGGDTHTWTRFAKDPHTDGAIFATRFTAISRDRPGARASLTIDAGDVHREEGISEGRQSVDVSALSDSIQIAATDVGHKVATVAAKVYVRGYLVEK